MQLFKNQSITHTHKAGREALIVHVRYDDHLGNGHNTLSVTGTLCSTLVPGWGEDNDRSILAAGRVHDSILNPKFGVSEEIKNAVAWHLANSDSPLYYIANTMFHASDRDCYGRRKGDVERYSEVAYVEGSDVRHTLTREGIACIKKILDSDADCRIEEVYTTGNYSPKATILVGYEIAPKWHYCPWDCREEAEEWLAACLAGKVRIESIPVKYSAGKKPDLAAARRAAMADVPKNDPLYLSNAQLMDEANLKATLEARLPLVQARFKEIILALGFQYGDE